MNTTLYGHIATELKGSYVLKNGQPVPEASCQCGYLVAAEFYLAVSRNGKVKKGLDGKDYTSDLYRIRAYGRTAETLLQFGQKGRSIIVTGNLLQEEWQGDQTVNINNQHPLYATLAQFTAVANGPVKADAQGNLYFIAKAPIKSITLEASSYDWGSGNPNATTYSPSNFVPNVPNQGTPAVANNGATGLPPLPNASGVSNPVNGLPPLPNANNGANGLPPLPNMNNSTANAPFGSGAVISSAPNMLPPVQNSQAQSAPTQDQVMQLAQQLAQQMMQQQAQPEVPNIPNVPNGSTYQVVREQTNPNAANMPPMSGYNALSEAPAVETNITTPEDKEQITPSNFKPEADEKEVNNGF